ncbi:hypothetical protein [Mycolicibacterium sp. HK-90]|uniref:hypothetical protein n=1 Tax=Mycolicibacterium sp. HK-90 TaxID=3056937 RepID=UPI0026583BCF|nr:hypothetical protein [Mycolicibacterium sp. HK-90]WKG03954.1 hypothetical protein QU592_02165 [Mycolicibacterium sp. HK-90]
MSNVFIDQDHCRLVRHVAAITAGDLTPTTEFVPIYYVEMARLSGQAVARVIADAESAVDLDPSKGAF